MNARTRLLLLLSLSQLLTASAMSQGADDEEPVDCVTLAQIDRTEIIDDERIAFHMRNGDIYLNQLRRKCVGLEPGARFSYRTSSSRICRVDLITILEDFPRAFTRGASCSLGAFAPIDEEMLAVLKGEEAPEEGEVSVVPIEVEE